MLKSRLQSRAWFCHLSAGEDKLMTANYFRSLAARCRTASRDCFDLFAKEEFRQLATEFNAKADELDYASTNPGSIGRWLHLV